MLEVRTLGLMTAILMGAVACSSAQSSDGSEVSSAVRTKVADREGAKCDPTPGDQGFPDFICVDGATLGEAGDNCHKQLGGGGPVSGGTMVGCTANSDCAAGKTACWYDKSKQNAPSASSSSADGADNGDHGNGFWAGYCDPPCAAGSCCGGSQAAPVCIPGCSN